MCTLVETIARCVHVVQVTDGHITCRIINTEKTRLKKSAEQGVRETQQKPQDGTVPSVVTENGPGKPSHVSGHVQRCFTG